MNDDKKIIERNIPGMHRHEHFSEVEHAKNASATTKRLLTYFAKEKGLVALMLIIVLIGTMCGVYAPSLQSEAIDMITNNGSDVSKTIVLMLVAYLIYSFANLLQGLLSAKISQRMVKQMRDELFSKIIDLLISYLDKHSYGDVMSRMTNDIENISTSISQSLSSLCSGLLTIIGTVCIMLYYCWQLALLSFATIILTVAATNSLSKKVRKYSIKRQELLGCLNGTVEEMISGYHTVVTFNHQSITVDNFCKTSDALTKNGY